MNDLRFAFRQLLENPGFTAVAVLTLALGIGANTAIFSVVDAVLLKPLPYDDPGQLVQVWEAPQPGKRNSVSPGAFLDWKAHAKVFDSLSLMDETEKNLTGDGEPERIKGVAMSARGLEMLRVRSLLGRTFTPQEDQVGSDKVIVLSHRFWTRRFGGNPAVIGQTLQLSDQTYAVIGVLPPRSLLWEEAEFVIPFALAPGEANQRSANWLHVMGRLKPGVSVEQAQVAMNALAAQIKPLYPAHKKDWGVTVVAMREQITGDIKPTLLNSFVRISFAPPGINPANGLTMRIALPEKKYPNAERRAAFFEQVIERIDRLPGIEGSGVTQTLPLAGYCPESAFAISGQPLQQETIYPVDFDFCTPGYFQAVGIPLLKGRTFDRRDKVGAPRVVIINEASAREYFPNEDSLSKRLYEIKLTDPMTFVAVPLILLAVALFACWLPARRAAHVDPMEALRYE